MQAVFVEDCPQLSLPEELLFDGHPRSIANAIQDIESKAASPMREVKVVVLGDGRVGKTQWVNRLRGEPFEADSKSTPDIDIWRLKFNGVGPKNDDVRARVYDFGGQPHLWSCHRFFLASQHTVFVVVIDGTRQKQSRLEYWLEYIRHYTRRLGREDRLENDDKHGPADQIRVPVLVVFSNCDRTAPEADRRVFATINDQEARKLVERYQHVAKLQIVREYSSKTDAGLPEARSKLHELIAGMGYIFRTQYPLGVHEVKEYLEGENNGVAEQTLEHFTRSMSVGQLFELFERVQAHAKRRKPDHQECELWLQMLRNLGVVHWVGDVPGVKRGSPIARTVYHVDWVRKLAYGIVCADEQTRKQRVATEDQLCNLMCAQCLRHRENCPDLQVDGNGGVTTGVQPCHREILDLMEACRLVFADKNTDRWLVLDWIAEQPLIDTSKLVETSRIRFTQFLSESLLLLLAGEWFESVGNKEPQDLCRNQLRLVYPHDPNVNVVAMSDTDDRVIRIFAVGGSKRNRKAFAQSVRDQIMRLARHEHLPCVQEGWITVAEAVNAVPFGSSVLIKAEHNLYPPWFRCGDGVAFDEAWELFCCEMLECRDGHAIAWRKPHDKGVDLLRSDTGQAYQCKSVLSGRDSDFAAGKVCTSYEAARKYQVDLGWKEYFVCTNVELTGGAWDNLPKEISKSEYILTARFWRELCRQHPDKAAHWFRVPVPIEALEELAQVTLLRGLVCCQ